MSAGGDSEVPLDPEQSVRKQKVNKIFQQFDVNGDGRLNRQEMAALVIAVNPRVKFSEEQISAILDEVFRTYGEFIEGDKGLSLDGLVRTYDDGAGDVDRDFYALRLELEDAEEEEQEEGGGPGGVENPDGAGAEVEAGGAEEEVGERQAAPLEGALAPRGLVSITDEGTAKFVRQKENVGAWASSPNNGIVYDETWKLIEDVELFLRRLDNKISGRRQEGLNKSSTTGGVDAGDWSKELGLSMPKENQHGDLTGRKPENLGSDYPNFKRSLAEFRTRADTFRVQGELQAFDAQMALGRTLSDHRWYTEALVCFRKAIELRSGDTRAHFRAGNALYSSGNVSEARAAYEKALETAQNSGEHSGLRPQVEVNLGIALEGEGMLLGACDHYCEAAILNPAHYRALKLLGSALLGVGEYRAAEKALEEAIHLKNDYADAHCDLGSAFAAMGESERANSEFQRIYIERAATEFQRAIDLKPDHVDALYNLGGLLRDSGKYADAAAMYSNVLELRPKDWRAQLNKAVSLLGVGDSVAARKALKEAFKATNRVEVYDAIMHLKHVQKKPKGLNAAIQTAQDGLLQETNGGASPRSGDFVVVEMSKFQTATTRTSPRLWLGCALEIRQFQKHTRLNKFNTSSLKDEIDNNAKRSADIGVSANMIRKAELEKILRRLLHFLNPEAFQASMKDINERILGVLDASLTGRVDLGMFLASIAPLCANLAPDRRKRLVFQILSWRNPISEGQIAKTDAKAYIKFLRAMYLSSQGTSDMWEVHGDDDDTNISFPEFVGMFDDMNWGFGILTYLAKLEVGDRTRHQGKACAVCSYPIIGYRFKETNANFNLCSICYSEGKVPTSFKQDEYNFKEYGADTSDSMQERFKLFGLKSSPGSRK